MSEEKGQEERGEYDVDYALPDMREPPVYPETMFREIMEEGLYTYHPGLAYTFKRHLHAGEWAWQLGPAGPDVTAEGDDTWALGSSPLLITERAVVQETDPDKALVLAWRYRGRKKETMRALHGLKGHIEVMFAEAQRKRDLPETTAKETAELRVRVEELEVKVAKLQELWEVARGLLSSMDHYNRSTGYWVKLLEQRQKLIEEDQGKS